MRHIFQFKSQKNLFINKKREKNKRIKEIKIQKNYFFENLNGYFEKNIF